MIEKKEAPGDVQASHGGQGLSLGGAGTSQDSPYQLDFKSVSNPTIDIELEQALLGACLFDPELTKQLEHLKPEHFSTRFHGRLWGELTELVALEGQAPIAVVCARMRHDPDFETIGGNTYLGQLVDKAPPSNCAETLAGQVFQEWRKRKTGGLAKGIEVALKGGGDVGHVLAYYRAELERLESYDPRQSRFLPIPYEAIQPLQQPWRINGVFPVKGVAFIVGQSRAGKSFLALDTTLKLSAGFQEVLEKPARSCGVVYVAAEDGEGCMSRVAAWRHHYNVRSAIPFELIPRSLSLLDASAVYDLKRALRKVSDRFKNDGQALGVVVFDTLSRCLSGADENSSTHMSAAFDVLSDIAQSLGVLVVVVAHFGKAGSEKGIRGWSGLDSNSDGTITVERNGDDPHLRLLSFAKVKNGGDLGQLAFRLAEVRLGAHDDHGDELSSCIPVFEVFTPKKAKKNSVLKPEHKNVFAALGYVTDHGQLHNAPTAQGVKPGQLAACRADVKARAFATGFALEGEKSNTTNQRFGRTLLKLQEQNLIRCEGDYLWII